MHTTESAEIEFPAANLLLVVLFDGQRNETYRQAHRRDVGHVRHGLMGEKGEGGHGSEADGGDETSSTAEPLRYEVVHTPHTEEGQGRNGQPHSPRRAEELTVREGVSADQRHADGVHPHDQHGLGVEPLVLPPHADPVILLQHPPRDLTVVSLPGVPESSSSEHREIENRPDDDDPQIETPPRTKTGGWARFFGRTELPRSEGPHGKQQSRRCQQY